MRFNSLKYTLTEKCNCNCTYCPFRKSNATVSLDTIRKSFAMLYPYLDPRSHLVEITGGEVLTEFALLREAIIHFKSVDENMPIQVITNLSLLNEEHIHFFKENHLTLIVSFDGSRETYDDNRVFLCGHSLFDVVLRNIRKLQHEGIDFYTTMTISPSQARNFSSNLEFIMNEAQIRKMGFHPAIDGIRWSPEEAAILVEEILKGMDMYVLRRKDRLSEYQPYHELIRLYFENNRDISGFLNLCCAKDKRKLFIDCEGNIFPCSIGGDFYGTLRDQFLIGNSQTGIDSLRLERIYGQMNRLCQINKQLCLYFSPKTMTFSKETGNRTRHIMEDIANAVFNYIDRNRLHMEDFYDKHIRDH